MLINARRMQHMRKGYGSRMFCLSVPSLTATYLVPNELTAESTNSNGLFQDKKCGFSAACPVTLPKIERLSLGFNTWWLFADSSICDHAWIAWHHHVICLAGAGAPMAPRHDQTWDNMEWPASYIGARWPAGTWLDADCATVRRTWSKGLYSLSMRSSITYMCISLYART